MSEEPIPEKGRDLAYRDSPIEETKHHAEHAARRASPWVDRVARAGYAAKGVVYATIGVLAMREALGLGGTTTGVSGAMRSMGPQPLDAVLLIILAAGLVGYALWKLVQGIMDPDQKGSNPHGIVRRVGYVGSGVIHGGLAFTAAQSVFGAEDSSEDAMAASAMAFQPPLGPILVGLVGLTVISVGLYQLYAAYGANFRDDLKLNRMSDGEERWVILAGRVGTAARALAIGVAGAFVVLAAYQSDPSETRGLGEALENPPAPALRLLHAGSRGRRPSRLWGFHASRGPIPSPRACLSCGRSTAPAAWRDASPQPGGPR